MSNEEFVKNAHKIGEELFDLFLIRVTELRMTLDEQNIAMGIVCAARFSYDVSGGIPRMQSKIAEAFNALCSKEEEI